MKCPSCGAEVSDGKRFCLDCGAVLPAPCATCGSLNPPGAKFCGDCGAKLDAASTTHPAARPERAPPPAASSAERRQLTVMFCDLVGSTALSARLDPEDLREVIGAYHRCVADTVGRYDGFVAKYMGDGVLVYFGYPQAHEDDAERAVRAGIKLRKAVRRLIADDGTALAVRVGIDTGLVVVGDLIGEGAAREQAVVGETPNLAARLQTLAGPNGVVIGPGTHRLVAGLFELADLGENELKGFGEKVQAWRVQGDSRAESRFAARSATGLTPFIGRQHELGMLLDRFEQAKDGEGQVVLLSGEPGIGKSRLAHALLERLADEPHTRLRYYCSLYHVNSALHPIIEQLERAAAFEPDDRPERKLDKLEALLSRATNDVAEVAPLFAALLSIPAGTRYAPLNMPAQRQRELTIAALLDQLGGLAAHQPVLMVLEDSQWLDPTSTELFERAIERVQTLPVLLLITSRPEFASPWTSYPHMTSLTLNRLGRRHSTEMIAAVAGGKPLPEAILAQIWAKNRRRAALRRGADQDRAGSGSARRQGRPLRTDRAAAAAGDPVDLAGFADGPSRPPRPGQGGGADRRGDRPRVLVPAGGRALAAGRNGASGGAIATDRLGAGVSPRDHPECHLQLQARVRPGGGLPQPAQKQAAAAPRQGRRGVARTLSRNSSRASPRYWRTT